MRDTEDHFALDAPAKLNLFLHVTGRRADGYHLLNSLVAFTEVGDRVTVHSSDELTLQTVGPFSEGLETDPDRNLILRAARALRDDYGTEKGGAFRLAKNLPVSSGIGGGSVDAAAALRLLTKCWRAQLDDSDLARIGLAIGADLPVCISGTPSIMAGIGDDLTPQPPFPPCGVALINGGEAVSTPAVFAARQGGFSSAVDWRTPGGFDEFVAQLRSTSNDLEPTAISVSPVIRDVLSKLGESKGCALARLSGSGGTCFGLFEHPKDAEKAVTQIRDQQPDWWCVATRLRNSRSEIETV